MVYKTENNVKVYLWSSLADGFYWERLFGRAGVKSLLVSYAKERFLKKGITEMRQERNNGKDG